jgi:hypothetical protein
MRAISKALYPGITAAERLPGQSQAVIVSSERLTDDTGWQAIPPNHMILLTRGKAPELRSLAHIQNPAAGQEKPNFAPRALPA